MELIHHLREIEKRMLYASMGFESLHAFCMNYLGLSKGSAHRRISSMRLIRDLPEAKKPLEEGALSLSTATILQGFFKVEKLEAPRKAEILKEVQGLSKEECERALCAISPKAIPKETKRRLTPSDTELKLVVTEEFLETLQELKGLLAHKIPFGSTSKILEEALKLALKELRKQKPKDAPESLEVKIRPAAGRTEKIPSGNQVTLKDTNGKLLDSIGKSEPLESARILPLGLRVYLPRSLKRRVWIRAQGKCEYVGGGARVCGSAHQLEMDHRTPLAKGGANTVDNLRLLCRIHNESERKRHRLPGRVPQSRVSQNRDGMISKRAKG